MLFVLFRGCGFLFVFHPPHTHPALFRKEMVEGSVLAIILSFEKREEWGAVWMVQQMQLY